MRHLCINIYICTLAPSSRASSLLPHSLLTHSHPSRPVSTYLLLFDLPSASPPICHLNWGCLSLWWQWASCQPNTLPPARTAFRIDSRPAIRQGVTGCPTPAFKVQFNAVSGCILCLVASGNTTQRPNSKYGRCVLHCALCCGFIFPEGYGLERKKKPTG